MEKKNWIMLISEKRLTLIEKGDCSFQTEFDVGFEYSRRHSRKVPPSQPKTELLIIHQKRNISM